MQAYRTHTTVSSSGQILIDNVPFPAGEDVEVLVLQGLQRERDRKKLVQEWLESCRRIRMLPHASGVSDTAIHAEIEAYRKGQ